MRKVMKRAAQNLNEVSIALYLRGKDVLNNNKGWGLTEVLAIAGVCIVAAFIVIPGLRLFAGSIITSMDNWWDNTIQNRVFPTS